MMKQQSHEEMFAILQKALWDYGDLNQLAEETGISLGTLYKYRRVGHSFPWPRMSTWQAIMPALGLRLELVKT